MRLGIVAALPVAFGLLCPLGCGNEVIDADALPVSIEGYEQWDAIELSGKVPGHGDSIRVLYRNDIARAYSGGGHYPVGSAMVKEIYSRDGDERGALRYKAVMRRITVIDDDPGDLPLEEGWLFTDLRGSTETFKPLCWDSCHVQAPYQGAYFDHGQ